MDKRRYIGFFFFFSSRRRHTRLQGDWSSDVCSSDLGWLSCDSIEAPPDTKDATGLVFRGLAQLPGFCLFRVDKQGVGDSEGVCAENDFASELAGYRAAFRALKNYDFIDSNRAYILGISNGGGFAPLVPESDAEQAQVRGYLSVGGWATTWFEHMLEIERRRDRKSVV